MKSTLKRLIDKTLSRFGYELSHTSYETWRPGRTYWEADYVRRLGFRPRTVVDVGVAYGTPTPESHALYEAFPESYFILIEPLKEFEPYMQGILRKYGGRYFLTGVGARNERKVINVEPGYIDRSSLYDRTPLEISGDKVARREIPVTTLDALMDEHSFQPPFGLKIDAEGHEIEVIEGAARFLQRTEFVISEVPVADRFDGVILSPNSSR